MTPSGVPLTLDVLDPVLGRGLRLLCHPQGRGATTPTPPAACSFTPRCVPFPRASEVDGGPGVGRVTKPGLDQPVGAAAINHVPRQMIEAAVAGGLQGPPAAWR